MERRRPVDNAPPHFLTMMVRAARAVDLLAKSVLLIRSRSHARKVSRSRVVVPKLRSSFCGLRPGVPIKTQQTTLA